MLSLCGCISLASFVGCNKANSNENNNLTAQQVDLPKTENIAEPAETEEQKKEEPVQNNLKYITDEEYNTLKQGINLTDTTASEDLGKYFSIQLLKPYLCSDTMCSLPCIVEERTDIPFTSNGEKVNNVYQINIQLTTSYNYSEFDVMEISDVLNKQIKTIKEPCSIVVMLNDQIMNTYTNL